MASFLCNDAALEADPSAGGCSCLDDAALDGAAGAIGIAGAAGATTGALIADPTEDFSGVDDVVFGRAAGATGAAGDAEATGTLIAGPTGGGCSSLDDEALGGAAGAPGTAAAAGGAGATTLAQIADPTEDSSSVEDVALGRAAAGATRAA